MKKRPLHTLFTVIAGSALTVIAALTVKTWAGMYLPLQTALIMGIAASFVPGYLVNKVLTNSYKEIEPEATEMGSIFGTLVLVNGFALGVVFLGLAGLPADVALEETLTRSYATLGFLDKPLAATLAPYPRSTTGTGIVWAPNLGTDEQPRVIARNKKGALKASFLPPRGKVFEADHSAVVGPVDKTKGRVMLCPVPSENDPSSVEIQASWSEGTARFIFRKNEAKALFINKKIR